MKSNTKIKSIAGAISNMTRVIYNNVTNQYLEELKRQSKMIKMSGLLTFLFLVGIVLSYSFTGTVLGLCGTLMMMLSLVLDLVLIVIRLRTKLKPITSGDVIDGVWDDPEVLGNVETVIGIHMAGRHFSLTQRQVGKLHDWELDLIAKNGKVGSLEYRFAVIDNEIEVSVYSVLDRSEIRLNDVKTSYVQMDEEGTDDIPNDI